MDPPVRLLATAYRDLAAVFELPDARRALVALNTAADGPPTTTAVDYWKAWRPPAPDDEDELWSTRIAASVQGGLRAIQRRYAEAAPAVVVAAGRVAPSDLVRTQDAVLTVADLLSTLTVEAAVHHLDLVRHLDRPGPAAAPLTEVRRVLEGLLDAPLPVGWDDVTAARRGTGREPLTPGDRAELGPRAAAFPLFG